MLYQERISFDHGRSWHMLSSVIAKRRRDMLLLYVIGIGIVALSFLQLRAGADGQYIYDSTYLLQLGTGVCILILTPFIRYGLEVLEDAQDERAEWTAQVVHVKGFDPLLPQISSISGRGIAARNPLGGMAQIGGELVAVAPAPPAQYRLTANDGSFTVPRALYLQWLDLGRPHEIYYSSRGVPPCRRL